MINHSKVSSAKTLTKTTKTTQVKASKILQTIDDVIESVFPEKTPLDQFLITLKRNCIANKIKEISSMFPTQSDLVLLTEPIELEPGTLIVVDSRLGWDMNYNDLYWVEEIKENSYLVRDNGGVNPWEYSYNKFWKNIFSRQEQGANAYIMYPNHPEYWTAKIRLGFKPPHEKKEINQVEVEARKVIREMVDWRDMLNSQQHLIFHNGQEKLIPVALEGYINEIPVDEIENTDFLKETNSAYAKIFNNTTFIFRGEQGHLVKMSYDELANQRWNQMEMGY